MNELSGNLRLLDLKERQAFYQERARRELFGVVHDERPSRRRLFKGRRAA